MPGLPVDRPGHDRLLHAARCYGSDPLALIPVIGGNIAEVYEFDRGGQPCILRLTPLEPGREATSAQATLAWMDHLSRHEVPIPRPLPSREGQLVESWRDDDAGWAITAFTKAAGRLSETMPIGSWSPPLLESLGRAVGRMHRASRSYQPPSEELRKPDWLESGSCFYDRDVTEAMPSWLSERQRLLLKSIEPFPRSPSVYGMIHADLHFANFFVDEHRNAVTLFDFDDCCYGWYEMDLAMLVFDALVLFEGDDREDFARHFLRPVLDGYQAEVDLDAIWRERMPRFVSLLELGVFGMLRDGDEESDSPWVKAFMENRERRIADGTPYLRWELVL